jgi:hypothetical protein
VVCAPFRGETGHQSLIGGEQAIEIGDLVGFRSDNAATDLRQDGDEAVGSKALHGLHRRLAADIQNAGDRFHRQRLIRAAFQQQTTRIVLATIAKRKAAHDFVRGGWKRREVFRTARHAK